MRYFHDVTTVDECRQKTKRIIDILHEGMPRGMPKPRTYRKKARKLFLRFMWNNYSEGSDLIVQIELHRVRYGTYPAVVCADKIYRTRANLKYGILAC